MSSAKPATTRHCEVCDQEVAEVGPWCDLYCQERKVLCWHLLHQQLEEADSHGDGPMVNALCDYGRKRYGECLHW